MKILVLNWRDLAHPRAGGAEVFVHEVTRRWSAQGHDVSVFAGAAPGLPSEERKDGVRIHRGGTPLSLYKLGLRFARSGTWDVVVESINTRPFFAPQALQRQRTVSLFHQLARDVWFHDVPFPIAFVGRYLAEPYWLRKYRGRSAIAVSESTRKDLLAAGLRDVHVVHNGVSFPSDLPRESKEESSTFMFLGRLQPSKRPDHAIKAFSIIRARIPNAKLWIVGDGPMRNRLGKMMVPGVTIFGRVDESMKWDLLSKAHLLLVPSVREGWGIVVMEAALVNTPAVGYNVPGLVDSIKHETTGWLCDPKPEAMAKVAISALPRAAGVGDSAAKFARQFNWDETAARILEIAQS